MKSLILLIISSLFLCSCASNDDSQLAPFEGQTLLVIPPICKKESTSDMIGRSLTQQLSHKVSSDIRYAGDIENLRSALTKENLMADGQLNVNEASRIGTAVQASEIVCVRVIESHLYPPQRATAIIVLRALNGKHYRQRTTTLTINMEDIEDRKLFAEFVGGSVRGPLDDRFIRKTNVNLESAMLSNKEFYRYLGSRIASSVLRMKH